MDIISLLFLGLIGGPMVKRAYDNYKLGNKQIVRIPFYGTIQHANPGNPNPGFTTPRGLDPVLKDLEKNPKVKGIILDINSGGGEAGASHDIYDILKNTKLPKVAWVSSLCASGAYMAASACNSIVAYPDSIIGSTGVIMKKPNVKKLMEKVGVGYEVIKSGKHKDILSMHRDMTDEERQMLEDMIMASHKNFIDLVYDARVDKIDRKVLEDFATGKVTYGTKAVELGLIDRVGNFDLAVKTVEELGNFENTAVFYKLINGGFFSTVFSRAAKSFGQGLAKSMHDELEEIIKEYNQQKF